LPFGLLQFGDNRSYLQLSWRTNFGLLSDIFFLAWSRSLFITINLAVSEEPLLNKNVSRLPLWPPRNKSDKRTDGLSRQTYSVRINNFEIENKI
jgi:hypothetical protein